MTKIVINKENEITKLENMLETLTDEKDKQSVRFAINVISGFNEVLSDRHNPFISKYQHDFVSRPTEVVKVGEPLSNSDEINKALEKGDIYRRGFEDGYLKGKEERPQGEWIPVSERLPDDREDTYWVCTDGGYQCECRWTNFNPIWTSIKTDWHWCIFDILQYQKVVAWQPLPEPYKKGGAV